MHKESAQSQKHPSTPSHTKDQQEGFIASCCQKAWGIIAPVWPLQTFIARNPLSGLEGMPFERALEQAAFHFQQDDIPEPLQNANRETIKWCQAFFDEGQAALTLPLKKQGLYNAWKALAYYDKRLYKARKIDKSWFRCLPDTPEKAIVLCLNLLNVPQTLYQRLITLLLTTLPGWAGYIKHQVTEKEHAAPGEGSVTLADYLAIRLILVVILWPSVTDYMLTTSPAPANSNDSTLQEKIAVLEEKEKAYRNALLPLLKTQAEKLEDSKDAPSPDVQLIFCIDVRSEPFRRRLEALGNYETLGFAGFFGLPIKLQDYTTGEITTRCPVLLKPQHTLKEGATCSPTQLQRAHLHRKFLQGLKACFNALKHSFVAPFALVEASGPWFGLMLALKTLAPMRSLKIINTLIDSIFPPLSKAPLLGSAHFDAISGIAMHDQCRYAENALRLMGLTKNFAPLVIFCGHQSTSKNNPYTGALNCGACGGHPGGVNAQVLATILNQKKVRRYLATVNIVIDDKVVFLAAEHDTTTDEVTFCSLMSPSQASYELLQKLHHDFLLARQENCAWRCAQLGHGHPRNPVAFTKYLGSDWAQRRPEGGLAKNASLIIGPRRLTKSVPLEGRAFLHSYEWRQDHDSSLLETILLAPMIVTQWINSQYLFSTLDNVAYGGGSKITQNITGRTAIMQGNASDVMHGLALQSVFSEDTKSYHQALRLLAVVYAPRKRLTEIIKKHKHLQNLFGNKWMTLTVIDPHDQNVYLLQPDFSWEKTSECL